MASEAEREGFSHLKFLHRLIAEQATQRRERSIAYPIREARFREPKTLATFDWLFNAKTINRSRVGELATCEFILRHENLVLLGQSGVGKSHLIQAIRHQACVAGWRVRYTTSAKLLEELRASMADQTLPTCLREYSSLDLLIIDEFGFDWLERQEWPQAASLLYKGIDSRTQQRSTILVTNIDFGSWGEYLGDTHLALALTDRMFDGAIIVKITGQSYRAHRAQPMKSPAPINDWSFQSPHDSGHTSLCPPSNRTSQFHLATRHLASFWPRKWYCFWPLLTVAPVAQASTTMMAISKALARGCILLIFVRGSFNLLKWHVIS
jgi:DNA replication protein DnaC